MPVDAINGTSIHRIHCWRDDEKEEAKEVDSSNNKAISRCLLLRGWSTAWPKLKDHVGRSICCSVRMRLIQLMAARLKRGLSIEGQDHRQS